MEIPFDEILAVVRNVSDSEAAFKSLRRIASEQLNSPAWDKLPSPGAESDIWEAAGWLGGNVDAHEPTEVCITLATRDEGDRMNASMAMIVGPDPAAHPDGGLVRYADRHCVQGLRKVQSAYKRLGLKAIADEIFFLGYGGVVLMAAVERLKSRRDCLFLWGMDEGPYGQLAQNLRRWRETIGNAPRAVNEMFF